MEIQAIGEEFHWRFIYPGPDLQFGTGDDVHANQFLVIPKDKTIRLTLTSHDYIYMFRPSGIDAREVAVPELEMNLSFQVGQSGKYKLEIDPLCSFNFFHDNDYMGWMIVKENKDFVSWYQQADELHKP